jgi:23S rRNA (uridine2552-2'-O)-methyltransferase
MSNKNPNKNLTIRVKTAKGRRISSTTWLQRQLNDPYVIKSKIEGYRSRAAYKLLEINDKFNFLRKGQIVIDLGAAPGGWTQVAVQKVKPEASSGKVIGIDLVNMEEIEGAILLQQDFLDDMSENIIKSYINNKADVVLSDMAAASCGHPPTDHLRIIALCEAAYYFAKEILAPGGSFVAKILKGGTEHELLKNLKHDFISVKHFKPPASRADSAESYVVAIGFRG